MIWRTLTVTIVATLLIVGCTHHSTKSMAGGKSARDAEHQNEQGKDNEMDEDEDEEEGENEGKEMKEAHPEPKKEVKERVTKESSSAVESEHLKFGFEDAKTGATPTGWTVAETHGTGTPATWRVAESTSAPYGKNVLNIESKNSGGTFNVLLTEKDYPANVELAVKIHANTGNEDQGGGLIWRAKDANNYYLARWNPLESNIRAYKVVDGKRTMFTSVDPGGDRNTWHTLGAHMTGPKMEVFFDGKSVITLDDATLTAGGKVGLWTKADASSSFDDFNVYWHKVK